MTTTERLYYTDARQLEFRARVVERADDGRRVYLDRTAFYPTSGGQPHDVGTLGGARVVDVVDEDDRIAHILADPLPADALEIAGAIDAARRADHMQQHTGQHLVSALLHERYGWRTLSVHFGDAASTVDVDAPIEAVQPRLAEAERECNRIVLEDRVVAVSFEAATSASGLRKASDREGTLRVVTIEDLDRSACGGTHVRATGEIGAILLRRVEKVKQGTRIEFLCGMRAVARARRDFEALAAAAKSLSVAADDLPAAVAALQEQVRESEKRRRALEAEAAADRAVAIFGATPPGVDGVRRAVDRHRVPAVAIKEMNETLRAMALAFALRERAIFVGVLEPEGGGQASVVVAASDDSGLDAGGALRDAITPFGGRGGGSSRMAQGSVAAEHVDATLRALGV